MQMTYTADDLKKLPLRAIVAFAVRCARRVERVALPPGDHPEEERCRAAVAGVLQVAEDFARGLPCPTADPRCSPSRRGRRPCRATCCGRTPMRPWSGRPMRRRRRPTRSRCARSRRSGRWSAAHRILDPLSHLADLTADLAALGAFTAATDAAEAVASTDEFTLWASLDYRKLLELKLGGYPEAGQPIDPSPGGPLGPLRPGAAGP